MKKIIVAVSIAVFSLIAFAHGGSASGVGTAGMKLIECPINGKVQTVLITECKKLQQASK